MYRKIYSKFKTNLIKISISGIFVLLIFFFVSYPLFHKGFFPTFDDVQVVRIDQMTRELESGQFPVRYVDDLGNGGGYMFFQMYPPLAYYVGSLHNLAGISLVKTTKLVFILGFALGVFGMILLLRFFADWPSSLMGMALFTTSPFLNYEIYTRGTVSEFLAFNLLPLVLWSFLKLKTSAKSIKDIILPAILYATIITAHTFPALIISPFLFLILLIPPFKKKVSLYVFYALILGLGISAFFWLPLLLEQKYTVYSQTYFATQSYKTNFLNILQLFQLEKIPWSFRPPIVGINILLGLVISVFIISISKIKQAFLKNFVWFVAAGLFASLFFSLSTSESVWKSVSFLQYLQFPWRFMIFITFYAVILITIALSLIKKNWLKIFIGLLLLVLSLTLNYGYLRPSTYNFISTYYAEDPCSTTTWANEYLPIWVSKCLPKSKIKGDYHAYPLVNSINNMSTIINIKTIKRNRDISFTAQGLSGRIVIGKYYFPGWQVLVDGKNTKIYPYGQYGLISFNISSGVHQISVILTDTPVRKIANFISGLSLLFVSMIILSFGLFRYKSNKK